MPIPRKIKEAPRWLKVACVLGAGLAFAPVALYALTGLFALMVAVTLALVGWYGGPVLAEKLANMKQSGLVGEWKKNPIPTLQRQYAEKVAKLSESAESLKTFIAKVSGYAAMVRNYKERFPHKPEKHKMYDDRLGKYKDLQAFKEMKFRRTKTAIEKFGEVVIEAEAEWEMALAAQDVDLAADFNDDPMELLKSRTALSSVEEEVNRAFAELDMALLEEPRFETEDMKYVQVEDHSSVVLELPSKEPVKIAR